jgi:flagellar FliL protein
VAKKNKKGKGDAEGEEEASGGKNKIVMIIGAVLALGAVYNFVLKPAPVEEDPLAMVDPEPIEGEIYELPEMVINLQDPEVQYVRVGVALILEEGTLADDFELESAIAKDVILEDLSGRTAEELRSAQGKQDIKAELSTEIREAYGGEKVVRVLFTALVMQ